MTCKNCNSPLEEGTIFCPKCGLRVENVQEATAKPIEDNSTAEPMESDTGNATGYRVPFANSSAPHDENNPEASVDVVGEAYRRKSKRVKWLLVAVVAAALVILTATNLKALANMASKLFLSPQQYYAKLETREVKKLADFLTERSENPNDHSLMDKGIDLHVETELGKDACDLLTAALEVKDGSAFSNASIDLSVSMQKDVASAVLAAALKGNKLLTVEGLADWAKGNAYVRIPELSMSYLGLPFEEVASSIQKASAANEKPDALFDMKTLAELLERYLVFAIESITEVTEQSETLVVGDMEKKCTTLYVTLTETDRTQLALAVLEKVKEDEELLDVLVKLACYAEEANGRDTTPEEMKKEINDDITEGIHKLKNPESSPKNDKALTMLVFVNSKGEIVGREFQSDGKPVFSYKRLTKGQKFEARTTFFAEADGGVGEISLNGAGECGASLSGDFSITGKQSGESETSYIEIAVERLDMEKMKQGYLNGSVTIKPTKELFRRLNAGVASLAFENFRLKLESEQSKDGSKTSLSILNQEEVFGKVSIDAKLGAAKPVTVPTESVSVEDLGALLRWLSKIDFNPFIDTLETAGLPSELITTLREYAGLLSLLVYMY